MKYKFEFPDYLLAVWSKMMSKLNKSVYAFLIHTVICIIVERQNGSKNYDIIVGLYGESKLSA